MNHFDAPVSGGVGGAAAGTLTFMVGGAAETFDRPSRSGSDGRKSSIAARPAPARRRRSATI